LKKNLSSKRETKPLTEKEKKFAQLYVDNFFSQTMATNTELAVMAGYAKESAYQRGYENTTYSLKPHVVNYTSDLVEDFRKRNQITPDKHMARLHELGRKAEDEKMYGVAVNAEVYRGKTAGYYVEKKLIAQQTLEDLSVEEIEAKRDKLLEQYQNITSHETEEEDETK
jgi:phage terminase small subunit